MTDRENGYEPYDVPLTSLWVWKNPNGHIARGEAFMTKQLCAAKFKNCLGTPVRFVAPNGKEFKEKAKRWAIQNLKKM